MPPSARHKTRSRQPQPQWARYCELSSELRAIYGSVLSVIILTHGEDHYHERRGLIGVSSARTVLSPAPDTRPLDLLDELWDLLGEGDWLLAAPDADAHRVFCSPIPVPIATTPLPWPQGSAPQENDLPCPLPMPTPLPHSNDWPLTS